MSSDELKRLAALDAAIERGALRVEYDNHSVTYRSLVEMMQIRDRKRRELGLDKTESRVIYAGRID